MTNDNNSYVQNSSMNIRKDNDDWCRAVDTVDVSEVADLVDKTITENGTYAASDDGVSGYSSVSVDVSGGGISPSYITYGSYNSPSGPGSEVLNNVRFNLIIVTPDDNGAVSYAAAITEGSSTKSLGNAFVYGENVKRINVEAYLYAHAVTFKAGEDFEGFYYQNEPVTFEGTITAGTWYNALYKNGAVAVETNDYLGYTPIT